MTADDRPLLDALGNVRREFPDLRFGQMICTLAILARDDEPGSVWELEDAELLAAARRMLAERDETVAANRTTPRVQDVLP